MIVYGSDLITRLVNFATYIIWLFKNWFKIISVANNLRRSMFERFERVLVEDRPVPVLVGLIPTAGDPACTRTQLTGQQMCVNREISKPIPQQAWMAFAPHRQVKWTRSFMRTTRIHHRNCLIYHIPEILKQILSSVRTDTDMVRQKQRREPRPDSAMVLAGNSYRIIFTRFETYSHHQFEYRRLVSAMHL